MGPTMSFYVTRTDDGLVHVQNAVGGMLGQHHVHTPDDFERWLGGAPDKGIGPVSSEDSYDTGKTTCGCGLGAGEKRSGS